MRTDEQRNEKQILRVKKLLDADKTPVEIAAILKLSRQRIGQIITDYLPPSYSGRKTERTAKHYGKIAKLAGKLRNGRHQVVVCPRPATGTALLEAADKAKLPLSNFILLSAVAHNRLKIPPEELAELSRQRA